MSIVYHPDPEINEGVRADALASEEADLKAGYPPRHWTCPCGATHSRGHFQSIGVHRCLGCGYVGVEGVMWLSTPPQGARLGGRLALLSQSGGS